MQKRSAIVIGAGIVGLATARALALKGFSVKVFDRSLQACGASVRNFGMVWPVGQPSGILYQRALRSREVWEQAATATGAWFEACGSLHVACNDEEWVVLQELESIFKAEQRNVQLLKADAIAQQYNHVNTNGLMGGLFSADEMLVDPREAIAALPALLHEQYAVEFYWNKCVTYIADQTVYIGNNEEHEADLIFVCSGADFETLYPEEFSKLPITKCKLQMLRTAPITDQPRIGTAVCGGLSLLHYNSFKAAPSLTYLQEKMEAEMKPYLELGIHVMAAQNGKGEITIGDSHEYGLTFDPFDKAAVNTLILDYLNTFLQPGTISIAETWHGIYPKLTNGDTEIFFSPDPGVYILNGVGGAGMTLSFGLAEEVVEQVVM
ncbi:MAG: TIGR03364 family FAD-dependent oxidoreductase [Bacteroidetes bacterium]|nr:TIGR03364 family FAD-dependent oxidoreductase [Bacteroidota bacterium]